LALLILILIFLPAIRAQSQVYTITVDGDIGAGVAEYVVRSIDEARRENATLIIKLNTFGGLISATEKIIERMLQENSGIVVWVTPRGAKAFSAGTFILLASNVAVMDKGTSIGAAQPRPEDPKVTMAMARRIEGIAEVRGRPENVARDFVLNNLTMDSENALKENVIDLVAEDLESLLIFLGLEDAKPEELHRGWIDGFLDTISNPQVVMLLFLFGFFGILAEITTPGVGVPGVAGVICLILSFWGMGILELDYAGLALIALGLIMLGYELFTPGFAVFGIGGIVAMALGLMFVDKEPWIEVAGTLFKGILLGATILMAILLLLVRRSLKRPPVLGKEELVGKYVVAATNLTPKGLVRFRGELWTAVCKEGAKKDDELVVKDVKGNVLLVKKREKYRE
jgi:membrane-bound serine protease (ClpP class)